MEDTPANSYSKKRKKLIAFLNSYSQGISGGDARFIEIAKRMNKYDKIVVTSLLGKRLCEGKQLNAHYFITTKEQNFKNVIFTYVMRTIKALLLRPAVEDKDIFYSTSDFLPDVLPPFLWKLRKQGVKWIIAFHLVAPNPFYGPEQKYLEKKKPRIPRFNSLVSKIAQLCSISLMKKSADLVLTVNTEIKDYLVRKGIDSSKIWITSNGVDYAEIQCIKAPRRKIYDAVFVGRFHPQKGMFDLIKIWGLIKKQKRDCRLAILGGGTEKMEHHIRKEIAVTGLESNVAFLGWKYGAEKFEALKSSKVLLCPSLYESWGIVIAEAMACGLPVIAYDLPIYRDIYETSLQTVPIGNVVQFSEKVVEIINNEKIRTELGLKGRSFMERYDWDKVAGREMTILKEILL